jgi:hypothetical protein
MTRAQTASVALLVLSVTRAGYATGLADVAWTESNLDVLRTFDKVAIEELANTMRDDGMHAAVGEFAWIDLAGDKRYALVTRQDLSGRAYFDYLVVYWRTPTGKITRDWIEGGVARNPQAQADQQTLAVAEMTREKILRELGRDSDR